MLPSQPSQNIRYNGTGRAFVTSAAGTKWYDLGEFEDLTFTQAVATDTVKSTRNAARGTILTAVKDSTGTLKFGLRELSKENLQMVLMCGDIVSDNQVAGYVRQTSATATTVVSDLYVELGQIDVGILKITHGSASFTVGTTVYNGTTATATAHGVVAYQNASKTVTELVNVSGTGTFTVGATIEDAGAADHGVITGLDDSDDVCVTNLAGNLRHVNGVDYSVDSAAGMIRKLSSGGIASTSVRLAYDYPAITRDVMYGLAKSIVTKRFKFITDKDDSGPRQQWTFNLVDINSDGDIALIGTGSQLLKVKGEVKIDVSQPVGQRYYKLERLGG